MQKMIKLFVFTLLIACQASFAQTNKTAQTPPPFYTYVFTADSLAGFDESAARNSAISEGFLGEEFKVRMWQLKRVYVSAKYGITPKLVKYKNSTYNSVKTMAVAACVNEDFEGSAAGLVNTANQINGWTISSGLNQSPYNSCNLPPLTGAPTECELITAPTSGYIDPVISGNYPIYSVFGTGANAGPSANPTIPNMYGTNFIRINSNINNYSISKLSKTFLVSSSNALFQFAFISVFSTGHTCCDAGAFQILLTNATANTLIPCPNFTVSAPSTQCAQSGTNLPAYFNAPAGTPATSASSLVYNKWKVSSIDLTAYIGQSITIDVIASDCTASGHYGYVYFDAQCGPMTIIGNNQSFAAGTASITLPTCGSSGATIIAPSGLGPYQWAGPGVGPPFTTPAYTNQTYTTNISGNFTLTMNPPGSCQPIIRIITVSITPAPQIVASVQQAPCGGTVAIASCTTAGSASVASTIVWSPTPVSLNSTTTQATYTIGTGPVTVTATDPLGCTASAVVNINGAPPIPTLAITNVTGSGSITCTNPTINYIAQSNYTAGAVTYSWVSLSGTATGSNVTFSNPAQYTVTITDPATGCSSFSVFTIGINVTVPTSTVTPTSQNIICPAGTPATFTAVTTSTMSNITFAWYSPFSPGAATSNATVSIQQFLAPGIYTNCLTNNINGCSTCKTLTIASLSGFPSYSVTSPQQFTIGCGTTSLTSINISNVNTYTSSTSLPTGGPVSYTVLPPSFVGPTYTVGSSAVYTVNIPGTYSVIVHDNTNNCETVVQVSIIQNTFAPQISAAAVTPTLSCYTNKTILQGTSTNTNTSFSWAFAGPPAGQLPNDTMTVFTTTAVGTQTVGTYTLTITDNVNKCKSTQTLTIYQDTKPPIPVITPPGASSITCTTPTINLTNNSSSASTNSVFSHPLAAVPVTWQGPSPQPTFSNTTTYIAYTPGIYTLTVIDLNNGCTAVTTKTIIDNRIYPIVNNPVAPAPFILDCGPLATTRATIYPIMGGVTTGFTYSWTAVPSVSFSTLTASLTSVNQIGEYNILVTNPANGCSTPGEVFVINGSLTGDFTPSPQTGYAPLNVSFSNSSASSSSTTPSSSITTAWSFGNGTSSVTANVNISPTTTYTNAGTYSVTMYVVKGTCMDTVIKVITVELPSKLEVPNVFTPNGDGNNDVFFLKVQNVSEIHAYIFDRWGNQVYETTSNTGNITWDGKTASGKDMPVGTYFYTIKATGKDGTEYDKKGNVSIYR
ncbi:MAG: gliding motility-associated C-terminal domain-containing protein [Bacteroidetes bacterium]|nr:gliding motility-associated C-terminal domain-containing protein [Bacteroidota bacterium]